MTLDVAIVSLYLPSGLVGGVPLQVDSLANGLVERGHRVTVFSYFPRPDDACYLVRQVGLSGWLGRISDKVPGLAMHTAPLAFACEDYSGFSVIHAHGDSHFISTSIPIVRSFHSTGLDQALYASTWRRRLGMLSLYPLEILSGLRAQHRVYVSKAQQRYLPFHDGAGCVIPNGVDLSLFSPASEKSPNPSILFVAGTMAGRKRGAALIEQFQATILPSFPSAELWMVCPERPSGAGVLALGVQRGESLAELYRRAWVFCLPSQWESFGVPYVEAMASGLPIVSTPNVGAREVLADGQYGVLVPEPGIGRAIAHLLGNTQRRQILIERGLERAQDYSLDKMVDRYERLYYQVVAGQRVHAGGGVGRPIEE